METKVSISNLPARTKFKFESDGKVFTVVRNYARKPNNSNLSGYVFYEDSEGNRDKVYFLHTNVIVVE